jgi:hypothetical protein
MIPKQVKKHKRKLRKKKSLKSVEGNRNIKMLAIDTQNHLKNKHQVKIRFAAREARVVNNPIVKILINRAKAVQMGI